MSGEGRMEEQRRIGQELIFRALRKTTQIPGHELQCCRDLHARELRSWSCFQVMFFCSRLARIWIFFYLWVIWLNSILFVIYIQTKLLWCFTVNIFSQELNKHAENWMWIFFSTRGENIHRIATLLLENYINAHITTDRQHCNGLVLS